MTLIELLVTMALVGVLGSIVMTSMITASQANRRAESRTAVSNDLALGTQRIARQVRAAAPIVKDVGAPMTGMSLTAQVYRGGERYRHAFTVTPATATSTGQVTETVGRYADETAPLPVATTQRTLVHRVANTATEPAFRYLDRDGNTLNPVTIPSSQVAQVVIALQARPREGRDITVRTSVFLRNYREY